LQNEFEAQSDLIISCGWNGEHCVFAKPEPPEYPFEDTQPQQATFDS
jgi:hypothetical protein